MFLDKKRFTHRDSGTKQTQQPPPFAKSAVDELSIGVLSTTKKRQTVQIIKATVLLRCDQKGQLEGLLGLASSAGGTGTHKFQTRLSLRVLGKDSL